MNALALYLSIVLAAIAPRVTESRRIAIAEDISTVVLSTERTTFDDDDGRKTALLLVSLAHLETGKSWARWIDDGRCNDPVWRGANENLLIDGDCDNGRAFGMWQVHPPGDNRVVGLSYVRDRKRGIRAALHVAQASIRMGVGLCAYSGERFPKCPKAERRLAYARALEERFPIENDRIATAD